MAQTRVGRLAALCRLLASKGKRHWPVVATTVVALAGALTAAGRNWTAVKRALDRAIGELETHPAVATDAGSREADTDEESAGTLMDMLEAGAWLFAAALMVAASTWAQTLSSSREGFFFYPIADPRGSIAALTPDAQVRVVATPDGCLVVHAEAGSSASPAQLLDMVNDVVSRCAISIHTWSVVCGARDVATWARVDPQHNQMDVLRDGDRLLPNNRQRNTRTTPICQLTMHPHHGMFTIDGRQYASDMAKQTFKALVAQVFTIMPNAVVARVNGSTVQELRSFLASLGH